MTPKKDICPYFNASLLRHYREKKYKTRAGFAKAVGVSRQAVDGWESGHFKPTYKHLTKMAKVLNIAPRLLITPNKRFVLDKWEDHLIDYLLAPPEVKKQTKVEIRGESETHSTTDTERELKLSEKGAIELTEKLGLFEEAGTEDLPDDNRLDDHIP